MEQTAIFAQWLEKADEDDDLKSELSTLQQTRDDVGVEDRFYRELAFGTGGLRGVLGAGTNRMNLYTVRKATQGLANYLLSSYFPKRVAIAYDSRIKSDMFGRAAAEVLAANGITVFIYSRIMPTPALSFAVRKLGCGAGICITASHNPSTYNGYKVYGANGCQITSDVASKIGSEIKQTDPFEDVKRIDYEKALKMGRVQTIGDEVVEDYLEDVLALRLGSKPADNLNVIYTPLNGTGLECIRKALARMGVGRFAVVPEQRTPEGNFPTCPFPNPEKPEALRLGIQLARKKNADILLATDPDCDRLGVAVKTNAGYTLLTGNEIGLLLLDYICREKQASGHMPKNPVVVKTVVTSDMAILLAEKYGVELRQVLTGFKFIGEQICLLEEKGRPSDFLFGFEESYGYLSGSHVRDKDAVNAAVLVCEMASAAKSLGRTLADDLELLFATHGYHLADLLDFSFEGSQGMRLMQEQMAFLRERGLPGIETSGFYDYREKMGWGRMPKGVDDLPASDVLEFAVREAGKLIIRPSGTEPKIKIYISAVDNSRQKAEKQLDILREYVSVLFAQQEEKDG